MDTSNRQSSQLTAYPGMSPGDSVALAPDDARTVFGQVMGLVALTLGFLALGAFIGRNLSGGLGVSVLRRIVRGDLRAKHRLFARPRAARDHASVRPRAVAGAGLGPVLNSYASADPSALWQAAGATGAFVASPGRLATQLAAICPRGHASCSGRCCVARVRTRCDLRLDPARERDLGVAGLVIFGGYTILDFNRLRRAGVDTAVPIAASIFLDVVNVFLFFLELFGGRD